MLRTVLAVPVLLLSSAACSGDPSASPPEPTAPSAGVADVSAVRSGLVALYAGDHPGPADDRDATCFADALLREVSLEQLEAAGVVVDGAVASSLPPLDRSTAEEWVRATYSCVDYVQESARAQVALTRGTVRRREYVECLRDDTDPAAVRAALVATLSGDWDTPEVVALTDAQARCSALASPG